MKVTITIEDKGNSTVAYNMEATVPDLEMAEDAVTPASVIALAIKAMFNNGMLADAGSHALVMAAEGVTPEESIKQKYDNSNT